MPCDQFEGQQKWTNHQLIFLSFNQFYLVMVILYYALYFCVEKHWREHECVCVCVMMKYQGQMAEQDTAPVDVFQDNKP